MAIKYNNQDVKHLNYNGNYCKQVIKDGVSVWAEKAGLLSTKIYKYGISSISVIRTSSNEPSVIIDGGSLDQYTTLYCGDVLKVKSTPYPYWTCPEVTKTIDIISPEEQVQYAGYWVTPTRNQRDVTLTVNDISGQADQSFFSVGLKYTDIDGYEHTYDSSRYTSDQVTIPADTLKIWQGSYLECKFFSTLSIFDNVYIYPLYKCINYGNSSISLNVPKSIEKTWAPYFEWDKKSIAFSFESNTAQYTSKFESLVYMYKTIKLRVSGTFVKLNRAGITTSDFNNVELNSSTETILASSSSPLTYAYAKILSNGTISVRVSSASSTYMGYVTITKIEMYGFLIDSEEKRWDYSGGGYTDPQENYRLSRFNCWDVDYNLCNCYCNITKNGLIEYTGGFMGSPGLLTIVVSGTYTNSSGTYELDSGGGMGLNKGATADYTSIFDDTSIQIIEPFRFTGYNPNFNGKCFDILMQERSDFDHLWEVVL